MINKHVATLLRDDYYVIAGTYSTGSGQKEYHFKVPNSIELKEGDLVAVPSAGKQTYNGVTKEYHGSVIKVTKVLTADDLDITQEDYQFKWIYDKIDTITHEKMLAIDANIARVYKGRERRTLQKEIINELSFLGSENVAKLIAGQDTVEGKVD